jgi:glycosyltransferase involved in cell wall biosynthesis
MKILFINKNDNQGGAAGVAWNLAKELRLLGHEVRFLVRRKFSEAGDVAELKENPVLSELRNIFNLDFTVVLTNWRDQFLANDIDFGESVEILDHPWLEWADIIHCHNLHGNYFRLDNLIEISRRKPVVWTLHDLWAVTGHCAQPIKCGDIRTGCVHCPRLSSYQKIMWDNTTYLWNRKREIYAKSKLTLTVPSLWMKSQISESILKDKPLHIIPNGVNLGDFKKIGSKRVLRSKYHLPQDAKIVLFFPYGRNNYDKGWGYISNLISQRKDLYFVGIGTKLSNQQNMKSLAPINDTNILRDYYNAADGLLYPSLAESFGMVPLEALCCGLPVVAFPVGIIPEVLRHKVNGYIARYGNNEDLGKGLDYILTRIKKIDKINSRYDIRSVALSYARLYEKNK